MRRIRINSEAFKQGQRVFTQVDCVTLCLSAEGGEHGTYTLPATKDGPPKSREYRPPTEDEMFALYDLGLIQYFTVTEIDIDDIDIYGDDLGQPEGSHAKGGKKHKQQARELPNTEHSEPDTAGNNGQ